DRSKAAADQCLAVRLQRHAIDWVLGCSDIGGVTTAVHVQPGDPTVAPDDNFAVGLNGDRIDRGTERKWILKAGVHAAVGVEPGNAIVDDEIVTCEVTADQNFAVRLDSSR